MVVVVCGIVRVVQETSSLPSEQSSPPSHRQSTGTQIPSEAHVNWSSLQGWVMVVVVVVGVVGVVVVGQETSSLPSVQSSVPSHSQETGIQ